METFLVEWVLQKDSQLFNVFDAIARSGVFISKELNSHALDTIGKLQGVPVLLLPVKYNSEFSPGVHGPGMFLSKALLCS